MRAAFVDWAMVSDRDGKLSLAPGAAVYVYDQGTTNLITDTIYAGASGGTTQANPLTAAADGEFAVYLDQPRMVTIKVTQAGYTDQSFDVAIVAPGVSYRGAWLTATAYREDQLVTNDGTTYIAISDHTSAAATEPGVGASWATVWEVFAEKGADGGGGHTIKEGATPFTQRTGLMFTAADFNLTDDAVGDETEVALAADVVRDADLAAYQALSVIDAKGDLLVGSANDATDNLPVGTNGQVLTADSTQTLGVKWASAPGPTEMFIPAQSFTAVAGSPSLTEVSSGARVPGWLFDASTEEQIATVLGRGIVPLDWTTFDIELWWSNVAASSGNVRWAVTAGIYGDGDTISTGTGSEVIDAAGGTRVLVTTTILTGRTAPTGTDPLQFIRIYRAAADGTDTLANDAAVYGVRLIKAS